MSDSFDMDEIKTELTATVMSSRGGLPLNEIECKFPIYLFKDLFIFVTTIIL